MVKSDFLCVCMVICVCVNSYSYCSGCQSTSCTVTFLVSSTKYWSNWLYFRCYSQQYSENSELFLWNSNILQQNLGNSIVQSLLYFEQITEFHKLLPLSTSAYCAASNAFFLWCCSTNTTVYISTSSNYQYRQQHRSVLSNTCRHSNLQRHPPPPPQYLKSIQHFYFLIFFTLWEIWKPEPAHWGILRYLKPEWQFTLFLFLAFILIHVGVSIVYKSLERC